MAVRLPPHCVFECVTIVRIVAPPFSLILVWFLSLFIAYSIFRTVVLCVRLQMAQHRMPVCWITPLGLPVVQPYRSKNSLVVRTLLQDVLIADSDDRLPVSVARQRSAFPPNYVHSLDSTHVRSGCCCASVLIECFCGNGSQRLCAFGVCLGTRFSNCVVFVVRSAKLVSLSCCTLYLVEVLCSVLLCFCALYFYALCVMLCALRLKCCTCACMLCAPIARVADDADGSRVREAEHHVHGCARLILDARV